MEKTKILWIGYCLNQDYVYDKILKGLKTYNMQVTIARDGSTGIEKAMSEAFETIFVQETIYSTPRPISPKENDKKQPRNAYKVIEEIITKTKNKNVFVLSSASKGNTYSFIESGAQTVIDANVIQPKNLIDKISVSGEFKNIYF